MQLRGDVDWALARLGLSAVDVGGVSLREWEGVDQIVIARFAPEAALIFPHAGAANIRRVLQEFARAGLGPIAGTDPLGAFPEAKDLFEARLLQALSRAESPLAIDVLLYQPNRWATAGGHPERTMSDAESRKLKRLIDPPLVVALGGPNIGKSSLLNSLAGRRVSLVADEPGTTRDHVGVRLDLAGLVVQYIDTPGIEANPEGSGAIQAEAQRLALDAARAADLVLLCADGGSTYRTAPNTGAQTVRIGLRADLGLPREGCDLAVSARTGAGLEQLVALLREELVPGRLLTDNRPWKFW